MTYLFFDLEFTSFQGYSSICEFGYVLTDESFHVLERNNLVINPNIERWEWNEFVLNTILHRGIEVYEASPTFAERYPAIRELLGKADYILGHSLYIDAGVLNNECIRYEMPSLDFEFYDIRNVYKEYTNTIRDTSVTDIVESLHVVGEDEVHDAETDSYNTMLACKEMMTSLNVTMEELIELCPGIRDENKNFQVKSGNINQIQRDLRFLDFLNGPEAYTASDSKTNKRQFHKLADRVRAAGTVGGKFRGKKIYVADKSPCHYHERLNLAQLIANEGGDMVSNAKIADLYVEYGGPARGNYFRIRSIPFAEMLTKLGVTEAELKDTPLLAYEYLKQDILNGELVEVKKNKNMPHEPAVYTSGGNTPVTTLGALFGDLLDQVKDD